MKVKGTGSLCMFEEYVKDNYYAMLQTAITAAVKYTLVLMTKKSVEREMQVNGSRSWCALEEYSKDIYNARFHTHSYHYCREIHFSSRLGSKF